MLRPAQYPVVHYGSRRLYGSTIPRPISRRKSQTSPLERFTYDQRHNFKVHKIIGAVKRRELDEIVNIWVDTALRIDLRNLRMMDALVARQSRFRK